MSVLKTRLFVILVRTHIDIATLVLVFIIVRSILTVHTFFTLSLRGETTARSVSRLLTLTNDISRIETHRLDLLPPLIPDLALQPHPPANWRILNLGILQERRHLLPLVRRKVHPPSLLLHPCPRQFDLLDNRLDLSLHFARPASLLQEPFQVGDDGDGHLRVSHVPAHQREEIAGDETQLVGQALLVHSRLQVRVGCPDHVFQVKRTERAWLGVALLELGRVKDLQKERCEGNVSTRSTNDTEHRVHDVESQGEESRRRYQSIKIDGTVSGVTT
jgi:hypothetical protein